MSSDFTNCYRCKWRVQADGDPINETWCGHGDNRADPSVGGYIRVGGCERFEDVDRRDNVG